MYESFYGLTDKPFSLAPDHRYFFESAGHKRGLAYLQYGLHQGQGFIVVTGMPGTGKSTLVHNLLQTIQSNRHIIATINNTNLDEDSILQIVANSFGVYRDGDGKAATLAKLEKFFYDQHHRGKQVLLLVDEAQNLPSKSLEELRMLSNFQHGNKMLLQIMLVGQKQLQDILADREMEQLTQRVIASYHLEPMTSDESYGYVRHRLLRAGWQGHPNFSASAMTLIYRLTQGVPRLINVFCDRLLLYGFLEEKNTIGKDDILAVVEELKREAAGNWLSNRLTGEVDPLPPLPKPDEDYTVEPIVKQRQVVAPAEPEPVVSQGVNVYAEPETTAPILERAPEQFDEPPSFTATRVRQPYESEPKKSHAMAYAVVFLVVAITAVAAVFVLDVDLERLNLTAERFQSPALIESEPVTLAVDVDDDVDVVPVLETAPDDMGITEPVVEPELDALDGAGGSSSSTEIQNSAETEVKENAPAAKPTPVVIARANVSDTEASDVVYDLIMSYQEGSLKQLIGLFDRNAVDGKARGRSEIAKRYEGVFNETYSREMRIEGVRWRTADNTARGKGDIKIATWSKGSLKPEQQQGVVEIEAVKKGDQVLIKKLSYQMAE